MYNTVVAKLCLTCQRLVILKYRKISQRKTSADPYLELPSDEINTGLLVPRASEGGENRGKLLVPFASLEDQVVG